MSEPPPTPPPGSPPASGGGTPQQPVPTPPPRPTTKRGKPKKPKVQRKGFGTYAFVAIIGIAVLVAAWQLYEQFTKSDEPAIGDHIHAALGISICGFPAENAPTFEVQAGTETKAGLHSHGDGLLHIHPFTEEEAGDGATVGRFMDYGGWEVADDHLTAVGRPQRDQRRPVPRRASRQRPVGRERRGAGREPRRLQAR